MNEANIEACLQHHFQIGLDAILHPVSEEDPCGAYLKYNSVYQAIKDSRRSDDPTLPQGIWSYELKRADWQQVSNVAFGALCNKSKDLQLGIWLLEANIHLFGFKGIAPCCLLLAEMCKRYWDAIHPRIIDDDIEFRINPFVWANEKLVPSLRLVPVTRDDNNQPLYNWADWLTVNNKTNKSATHSKKDPVRISMDEYTKSISLTKTEYFLETRQNLLQALFGITYLSDTLDELCGDNAPSFNGLLDVLSDINSLIEAELNSRGALIMNPTTSASPDNTSVNGSEPVSSPTDSPSGQTEAMNFMTNNSTEFLDIKGGRYETYMQLEQMAHYLMEIDPHSPSPYLILQACRWGRMDTRDLYRELFIECHGQLDIFELLGVDKSATLKPENELN